VESFGSDHYVPVLFTKAGERDALGDIDDHQKAAFTPLFVAHPIDWDFELDQPKKTVDQHLAKLPADLQKVWDRDAFIDVLHLDSETMANGRHPLEWMVTEAVARGLPLIPVTAPGRSAASHGAVSNLLAAGTSTDVCLRLGVDHWGSGHQIDGFLSEIGAQKANTHLVLDLRNETGPASRIALSSTLQALPTPSEWKTLTVTATAMPQTPPAGQGLHEIVRQEWLNYQSILSNNSFGQRRPTFGDYAIAHPDPFDDVDPRMLQISAKLKYTSDDAWLLGRGALFKGTGGRSGGGEAIRPVALAISAHNHFTAPHCTGEDWILAAAADGPTGAPRTWVRVGTLHHLLRVLDQIGSM
jgi:hypothetical protein